MKCLFYKEFKDDLWGNARVGGGHDLLGSLLVTFCMALVRRKGLTDCHDIWPR